MSLERQEVDTARRPSTNPERRSDRHRSQRVSTLRRLVTVWVLGLAGMATVGLQERGPVEDLLLDPSVVGRGLWYGGLVTSIGIMIWTVAAGASFGAAYISWLVGRSAAATTMAAASGITALLLLDDVFLLHSNVVPGMTGLPKVTLVLVEGVLVVAWWSKFSREIVRMRWELLLAAGVGFATSVAVDQLADGEGVGPLLVEDGAKLLGILALAAWSVSTAGDLAFSIVRAGHVDHLDQ